MAIVGYARVSSYGQSLEVQLDKLSHCEKVFQEKKSGRTDNRAELQNCLTYLRDGDTLVITKLDRLGRSIRDLLNIINQLEKNNVSFQVLDQQIDTSTPSGKLLLHMLGAIAEFENDLRASRQSEGIQKALSNGVQFGRKSKLTDDEVLAMRGKREAGTKIKDLMAEYGLSKASIYRLLDSQAA
ncbi:MAG: recombinase family protein [Methylococcales bacterium]|nr:recombinase family protein [Methylococcales bacterium]